MLQVKVEELQCKVEELQCKVEKLILATVSTNRRSRRKRRREKVEAEKEAKAKLLTQPSNTELYIVRVTEKLESAKEAFENAD